MFKAKHDLVYNVVK